MYSKFKDSDKNNKRKYDKLKEIMELLTSFAVIEYHITAAYLSYYYLLIYTAFLGESFACFSIIIFKPDDSVVIILC